MYSKTKYIIATTPLFLIIPAVDEATKNLTNSKE
jgi:hypothetical protein